MAAPPAMAYKYLPPNGLNLEIKPAVEKAMQVLADRRRDLTKGIDEETRRIMFGDEQFKKR